MRRSVGIRKETKDKTQRRAPLSPDHVRELVKGHGIKVLVEPWKQRVFSDSEYVRAGARLTEDISRANIIFGIKEIAPEFLSEKKAYCFFSHTVKGQSYNMPMLQTILDRRISLFDYELVKNKEGKRLIFFGEHAGYAGMIDSLWALGRRLQWENIRNPFSSIRYATKYRSLSEIREHLSGIANSIARNGIARRLVPLVCGFTGHGHVSSGAQELFNLFPHREITVEDLPAFFRRGVFSDRMLYKVRFRKPDMYAHRRGSRPFDAKEFSAHPKRYRSVFAKYLPYLTVLINGIYWEPQFPRLMTRALMRELYRRGEHRLRVVGDITCDVEGSIELTAKTTTADNPVYVVEPATGRIRDGWKGRGPVILAVDKLPSELPREASMAFGDALMPFVPDLAGINCRLPLNRLHLPAEFRAALIAHNGRLTPSFAYLKEHLQRS